LDFLPYFKKNFQIHIVSETPDELVFDMIGIDAPIANALRRIFISEVSTMAIETVFIMKNTSIVQDEVLAHRIGLIPIRADATKFEWKQPSDDPTDVNTLEFRLLVKGEKSMVKSNEIASFEGEDDKDGRYTCVYSSQLFFDPVPGGSQEERCGIGYIKPVNDDILIAKLAPGQEIHLTAHAIRGKGEDHAKWSPVCTASYRLLPAITLSSSKPFYDDEAELLVKTCPMKVFDIEDVVVASGSGKKEQKRTQAKVKNPRNCTFCRECIRPAGWEERVSLERLNDHFIFSVESTGAMTSREIVRSGISILKQKATTLRDSLEVALNTPTHGIMSQQNAAKHSIAAMTLGEDSLA
jgi:DNA-directed RNA polymerases I and III subunit RPAC1